ncbi:MAG TPA: aminoglycoside adenylyltransferase domain-containing protein [Longimicrobiales bacterium]|nr:aminoglycoside adenylyltransferase domain-containing protein [Longimicrobiales bacterium]
MTATSPAGGVGWTTCDPELRMWVEQTIRRVEDALGLAHVGTYLHGSLASGTFRPPKSDVDVIIVVDTTLDVPLRHLCARTMALMNVIRPIVGSFECSIVRRDALRPPTHPIPYEVYFREEMTDPILAGTADLGGTPLDFDLVAQVQATWEFGIPLSGPPVREIFMPPDPEDVMDALRSDLEWILRGEHILESPYHGVLNVARVLWVLEGHADRLAPSGEEAGEWMLAWVPERHRDVVRLALAAYRDDTLIPEEERRTAGMDWPRDDLLAFRDWASGRTRDLAPDPIFRSEA